jgi:bis(5'-nucleosyl)-tetraphosphatase (symmetrical)
MAIYAIGDIQGCYDDLLRLLEVIEFNQQQDQLWFVGDLVNRGPKSLETLRFVKSLGQSAVCVLGNHDLHLLAIAYQRTTPSKKDALDAILTAPDSAELIDWLRHRPLFHHNDQFCLLHAGLPPQWNFTLTKYMAARVERVLRSDDYLNLFNGMYGDKPDVWSSRLHGASLLRFVTNCFTRLRYCDTKGKLNFQYKGKPGTQPAHLTPWFAVKGRKSMDMKIIFGHWSTLGFYDQHNCYGIDTGALWGGQLTALRLERNQVKRFSIDCAGEQKPDLTL